MTRILLAAVAALALTSGAALAAGNPAIANFTTTSMGAPIGSPGYAAPRSEAMPGLPPQVRAEHAAREAALGGKRQVNEALLAPVQGPSTLGGQTQLAR